MNLNQAITALKQSQIPNPLMEARLLAKLSEQAAEPPPSTQSSNSSADPLATNPPTTRPPTTRHQPATFNPATFKELVARRLRGEPYSRIAGYREFWSINFKLSPDVLDPRSDSETLVEQATQSFEANAPLKILDLGCGSGCLLAALLSHFKNATGIGVDISQKALATARLNLARFNRPSDTPKRATLIASNWATGLKEQRFDAVVANPPYIPTATIATLAPEVQKFDPHLALDGGADGLAAYRSIFRDLTRLLKPHRLNQTGLAFIELGENPEAVCQLARHHKLKIHSLAKDYGGNYRCLTLHG